jgi:hypothetical protein
LHFLVVENQGFVVKIPIFVDQMPLFGSKKWSNVQHAPPWGHRPPGPQELTADADEPAGWV